MHNFKVLNNTFKNCQYSIMYSSVDGGLCQGNKVINTTQTNHLGINLYGGDVSLFKEYSGYNQEDYYTSNIIVADNVLTNSAKAGTAISVYGAKDCKVSGNIIENSNAQVTVCAAIRVDFFGNKIKYDYNGGNVVNSAIRTYGKLIDFKVHGNVFDCARIMLIDPLHRTISTGVSDTDYWGYDDSTVYIYDNIILQSAATSCIFINGNTETETAPVQLKDVPKLIMFENNRVINSAKTDVTVFQLNSTLQTYITTVDNMMVGQMCGYNNISYGLISAATKFRPYIPFTGNVDMD